jgi:large subunit ribosomal protein L25
METAMSELLVLDAERRDRAGKGAARAARRAGTVPAVVYGNKQAAELVSVDPKSLSMALRKRGFFSTVIALKLDGRELKVLPRDVQLHPVTEKPLHADFLRVDERTEVRVWVPVRFVNQELSPGIKRGGVLNVVRREIELVCPVGKIPRDIRVDLAGLNITDSVHISAIQLPEGVRSVIAERDFTIASIAAPTARIEEARAAQAAAAAAAAAAVAGEGVEAAPGIAPAAPGAAAPAAGAKPAPGAAPAAPAGKAPAGGGPTRPAGAAEKKPGGKS